MIETGVGQQTQAGLVANQNTLIPANNQRILHRVLCPGP